MATVNDHNSNSDQHPDAELERISALIDGELSDQDGTQLESAPDAQALADAYRRIDEAVLKSLACPPDQEAAIVAGSVRRVRELRRPKTLQYVLQAVAGIAAAAVVVFAWRAVQAPSAPGPIVSALPVDDAPAEVAAKPVASAPRPMVGTSIAESLVGTVHFSDVTLVSAGPVARPALSLDAPAVAVAGDDVADNVRHVWLVQDATTPLKWMRPLLPGHEQTLDQWIEANNDSYRLRLTLTDRELQGLVNQLASQGFALLSPDAPQPGLFRQGSFNERPVVYDVHFVEK